MITMNFLDLECLKHSKTIFPVDQLMFSWSDSCFALFYYCNITTLGNSEF
jgi:hypothetical protein